MVCFSRDIDILKYEPILFQSLSLSGQCLIEGSGDLDGVSFTDSGADFSARGVEAGCVIYVRSEDGGIDGCYEVVSVDSATELTVSVLRADDEADAIYVGSATGVSYKVATFAPQAAEVGVGLSAYFGIRPGDAGSDYGVEDIQDVKVLRSVSAFAVISSVYATHASRADNESWWKKSLIYKNRFERARELCRIHIDIDGDGIAEDVLHGGSVNLRRN